MIVWLVTTVALVVTLSTGVRDTVPYMAVRTILHVVYVAALLWHLARTGPSVKQLPDLGPVLLRGRVIGRLIPVVVIAFLFAFAALHDDGVVVLMLLLMIATLWVLVAWRREIRLRPAILGLAVAAIAVLGGLPLGSQT
jgi:hypothetical protein